MSEPTNVSRLPQRSPFRYPGGKTWLTPQVRAWLRYTQPRILLDAFTGGGSTALTSIAEDLVQNVIMVELDSNVASVWDIIVTGDYKGLCDRILSFELTRESVELALADPPQTTLDLAFLTILRNRVQRGGIMAPGAGLMRSGERGKGIASRWYPQTLARRITEIAEYRSRITFLHANAFDVIPTHNQSDVALFLDPPYTAGGKKAGSRLYSLPNLDHDLLFKQAAAHPGPVLMTYDNAPEVRALAASHGFLIRPISMRSAQNSIMKELLISKSLSFLQ